MATIYKKTITRPLPAGAELFTRKGEPFARWTLRSGKAKTAPVTTGRDGSQRIRVEASTYTAKYRDGDGVVREVATGCRSKQAAQAKLSELVTRAEKVRAKILSPAESEIADHQLVPLEKHIEAYIAYMKARKKNADRVKTTETRLKRSAEQCGFRWLADLRADRLRAWLDEQTEAGRSASVVNDHATIWTAFGNWCEGKRLVGKRSNMSGDRRIERNPFKGIGLIDPESDRRREARPLTGDEMRRLLKVASERPLLEAMTVRTGPNKGKPLAEVRPHVQEKLRQLGRERALIYKMAILTGLRLREIRTLQVRDLHLEDSPAYLQLQAGHEKNRAGSHVVVRSDLAADLRAWLADKLAALQSAAEAAGEVPPSRLPNDASLFYVPTGLLRIFNRDLAQAGIPKIDEDGKRVHVHGLRHTFGTELTKAGASPKTAQAAMRHSDIRLTMNTYSHVQLLDVSGAIENLPDLPLGGDDRDLASQEAAILKATGTDGEAPRSVAPNVAPDRCNTLQESAQICQSGSEVGDANAHEKSPETLSFPGFSKVGATRFELATSASRTKQRSVEKPRKSRGETDSPQLRCTKCCTRIPNPDHFDSHEEWAQQLIESLTEAEREAVWRML